MINTNYGDDSPIAAFATTPGPSALSLIRCSGKGALEAAASVFSSPKKLLEAKGNTVLHGWVMANKAPIDEVLISVFRAPKSYTGEDSLDISCHGGTAAGSGVLAALRTAGFRDALPGEFTFRAFMNGKIDLTKSESIMEIVSAKTETAHLHALGRLSGRLETEINSIKKSLVEILSKVELFLDYSEDEINLDETDGSIIDRKACEEALNRLEMLGETAKTERIYKEGILLVIAGRANAGKSSLFNLLIKEDRSIVTEVPGTTRDWIEAWISIEGIPIRLADTAGLRESSDPVEKIGIERSKDLLKAAGLVLYLIDGTLGFTREDEKNIGLCRQFGKPVLVLWNKLDLAPQPAAGEKFTGISAKTSEGVSELISAIGKAIVPDTCIDLTKSVSLGTVRQEKLVNEAAAALKEALNLEAKGEPLDISASFLRDSVKFLGEITGEVSSADILEEMFSKFCVGK